MVSRTKDDPVLRWLLEPEQPAVRFLASRDLVRPRPSDSRLQELRESVAERGWAADILSRQQERTWWETKSTCYWPKVRGTYWSLAVLADLGLTREDERISNAVEHMLRIHLAPDGGFSPFGPPKPSHFCSTGIMVRILVRLGYEDDPRTWGGIRWLLDAQLEDGGWDCHRPPEGTLDGWEAMAAFAALAPAKRTAEIRQSIRRGAEFYLGRGLLHEGTPYPPWTQLHYPWHYRYDTLVGLDFLATLGYGRDPRMAEALDLLRSKQMSDGRWPLEHLMGNLRLEPAGMPSKMVTFLARRVLDRVRASADAPRRLSIRGRARTNLHIA